METIYIAVLKGDYKPLAGRWKLEEIEQYITSVIARSHGNCNRDDFLVIPVEIPDKEDSNAR